MSTVGSETLDRIQQEIKESLEREEELRNKYNNNNCKTSTTNNNNNVKVNGVVNNSNLNENVSCNGFSKNPPTNIKSTLNGLGESQNNYRRFTPNPSAKGVMQKFLRMRGKLTLPLINTATNNTPNQPLSPPSPPLLTQRVWMSEDIYEPAKVTIEPGKTIRNGFVPADVKMRKELQEFQLREEELRKERRKSQPDLMAALEAEAEIETNLKSAKTMALLYSSDDLTDDNYSSGASSLKPARSLAELCDASDDDLAAAPGTHSLIKQFENLNNPQART